MVFDSAELAFADHVHDLDAGDKDSGAAKGFEAEHPPDDAFDGAVVRLDEVAQVLRLEQFDGRPLSAWTLMFGAVLAPLWSIVTLSGTPCRSMARSKNARAAA